MPYALPTPADLKQRYEAFASVDDAKVQYWLTDAERYVDQSWSEGDYAPALVAHAAYEMASRNVAGFSGSDVAGFAAAGVLQFKSGQFEARFSEDAVKVAVAGGLPSNAYGLEYLALLARNKSGIGVTSAGALPCGAYGFNGFAGPLPYWQC